MEMLKEQIYSFMCR